MAIRLAIVDGHTLTRFGLREVITQEADIEVVAECASAAEVAGMLAAARPDVITLDVSLPDGDGLRLAGELRAAHAELGVVILTSRDGDDVLFRVLAAGASAFVAKSAPVEEVLAAIRHAAVAASSFTATGLAGAFASRRANRDRLALSAREAEVLALLGDGLSIPAIALAMAISQSTAKTYVARLYEKLGATNRAQALLTAVRHGLLQHEQDSPAPDSTPRAGSGRGPAASGARPGGRPKTATASRRAVGVALWPGRRARAAAVRLRRLTHEGGAARGKRHSWRRRFPGPEPPLQT